MRRMSVCQTSYSSVLTHPDMSIACGQESHWPGSWIRANWGVSAEKQHKVASSLPFLVVIIAFYQSRKARHMHSWICVCLKGTSMTNCSSIFFSWPQELPGNDVKIELACRNGWHQLKGVTTLVCSLDLMHLFKIANVLMLNQFNLSGRCQLITEVTSRQAQFVQHHSHCILRNIHLQKKKWNSQETGR